MLRINFKNENEAGEEIRRGDLKEREDKKSLIMRRKLKYTEQTKAIENMRNVGRYLKFRLKVIQKKERK